MNETSRLPGDFKSKINWLMEHHRNPQGRRWTYTEVAEGTGTTKGYIHRLCNDPTVSNPSLEMLKKLCRFFGIGMRFFDDDFDFSDAGDVYETMIGGELATRMAGLMELSFEDKMMILHVIDHAIQASRSDQSGSTVEGYPKPTEL